MRLLYLLQFLLLASCGVQKNVSNGENLKDINNNSYKWIKIGSQTWMAENLRATHYANGEPIPDGTNIASTLVTQNSKFRFAYGDSLENVDEFGLLYTWSAALNGQRYKSENERIQGACPNGWHIPSDREWFVLERYLGMEESELEKIGSRGETEGGKLKQSGFELWQKPNVAASDEVSFNAKPAGYYLDGKFGRKGLGTYFWAAAPSDNEFAINHSVRYNEGSIGRGTGYKKSGFSIRCLKD